MEGHCQTNVNRPSRLGIARRSSCRELPPFGQSGAAVVLEDGAAAEMALVIEEIVELGVDGGELLKGPQVPELRHRSLSSSEWLMRVFGPIVEPAAARLSGCVTDYLHRRSV